MLSALLCLPVHNHASFEFCPGRNQLYFSPSMLSLFLLALPSMLLSFHVSAHQVDSVFGLYQFFSLGIPSLISVIIIVIVNLSHLPQ